MAASKEFRGRWYTRINGKKHECKELRDLENLILRYEQGLADAPTTINNSWDKFLDERKLKCAAATVDKDIRYYRDYIHGWGKSDIDVSTLTRDDSTEFFNHCNDIFKQKNKRPMKERYWLQILATIDALFEYFISRKVLTSNIFEKMCVNPDNFSEPKFTSDEDTIFSESEVERIKKRCIAESEELNSVVPLGFLLMFNLGLRAGEVCGLKWRDLYKENGKWKLHIRQIITKGYHGATVVNRTKTDAGNRILTLNQSCVELFRKIRAICADNGLCVTDPNELIFKTKYRNHWQKCTISCFNSRIRRYCKESGMSVIKSCHDARRTCITNLYNSGVELKKLQYFAGHETPEQTLAYVRATTESGDLSAALADDNDLFENKKDLSPQIITFKVSGDNW